MSFRLTLIQKVLLAANLPVAIAFLIACLAPVIDPRFVIWPAFFGLLMPVWVLFLLLFLLIWFFQKKAWWALNLLVLITGFRPAAKIFAWHPGSNGVAENGIRLITYNVQNFDLYNWKHNIRSRDSILDILAERSPDIVCFQEFYTEDTGVFNNISLIREKLNLPYYYMHATTTLDITHHWGLATFSRFPIRKREVIPFSNTKNNCALRTVLDVGGKEFTVVNVHLQSIHFTQEDFRYLERMRQEPDIRSSRKIAGKLKRSFRQRAAQSAMLAEALSSQKEQLVLCGDFNDPPVSWTYRQLSRGLSDAFLKKGFGIGATYAGNLPGLRIDYILTGRRIRVTGFERIPDTRSDHYPVMASFELK